MKRKQYVKIAALLLSVAFITAGTAASALALECEELVPMGNTVGIRLESDGVMVVDIGSVETAEGSSQPAVDGGMIKGDVIIKINGADIHSGDDFREAASKLDGETIAVQFVRNGETLQTELTPAKNIDGVYEMGMWLRDGMAGIGTVTFYDPESGTFGALGHAINDVDTGVLIPARDGDITPAVVTGVVAGKSGNPGELQGSFNLDTSCGKLYINTEQGVFGILTAKPWIMRDAIPVAENLEIKTGQATILCNVDGNGVEEYTVEISRLEFDSNSRNMTVTVTDKRLLETTGGIVQGMSGSPIIQDGKLIGAVTHVLVNSPRKGYGISIENMLETAQQLAA